jgi:hypothetical protein
LRSFFSPFSLNIERITSHYVGYIPSIITSILKHIQFELIMLTKISASILQLANTALTMSREKIFPARGKITSGGLSCWMTNRPSLGF